MASAQLLGYARVSTADQAPALQLDELRVAGCEHIWTDHATGTRADRPQLGRLLEHMREGDTLVVWRLARERMRTPAGRDAAIDRQTHAEGAIAELKHHGMGRTRCRGTRKTQLQLLAAATAINLKRLLSAHTARADAQAHDRATNYPTITNLLTSSTTAWPRSTASQQPIVQRAPRWSTTLAQCRSRSASSTFSTCPAQR